MAVDVLVNQYTERHRDAIIQVYEDNEFQTIYEDKVSVANRNLECNVCSI
jgi:CRISPR/Cas system-associated exonuclease Cas4 (RecB family)